MPRADTPADTPRADHEFKPHDMDCHSYVQGCPGLQRCHASRHGLFNCRGERSAHPRPEPAPEPRADHEFQGCEGFCHARCHHIGADGHFCGQLKPAHHRSEPAEREPEYRGPCARKNHPHTQRCLSCDGSPDAEPDAGDPLGVWRLCEELLGKHLIAGRDCLHCPIIRAAFERLVRECSDEAMRYAADLTPNGITRYIVRQVGLAILARHGLKEQP